MHLPILIGMNNPLWTGREGMELFPAPESSAGFRLWELMHEQFGISRALYLKSFDRRNLVQGKTGWNTQTAKKEAARLIAEFADTGRTIVMFGEDVRRSFGFKKHLLEEIDRHGCKWWQLPHPSGRNLWYNDLSNRRQAGEILEKIYNRSKQTSA